jgi:uncharacterized protein YrrD
MKKFLDIKGLDVIDGRGNSRGIIEDGVMDLKSNKICSFILSKKGIVSSYSLLSIRDIKGFGNMISANEEIYQLNRMVVKKNRSMMMKSFLGKEIVNGKGKILGNLADVIFDENTGQIKGLLCTMGFLEDFLQGRRLVITDQNTIFGVQRIVVGDEGPDIINDASFKKFIE